MAVPTITAVTPSSGHTVGLDIVKITGTNFRLPPDIVGYDPGDAQQTIKITIGGVDSTEAHAITATSGYARVPSWTGLATAETPISVDVRVANLDDDGDEISGENATLADGYSYVRTPLTTEVIVQRVTKELVLSLRRFVHPNTVLTTSPMYDDISADDTDRIKAGQLPLIKVIGPIETEDKRMSQQSVDEEDDPDIASQYIRRARIQSVDLGFTIQCWCDDRHSGAIYTLANAVTDAIYKKGYITVAVDPDDLTLGDYDLPWAITEMTEYDTGDDLDGLQKATLSCEIREVPKNDPSATIVERGYDLGGDDVVPTMEIL
jgi:hypothetical protein